MGFKCVYESLMDVFPQVDIRILRAVALEHSKDPDSAVEAVLFEILPALGSETLVSEPTDQRREEECELQEQTDLLRCRPRDLGKNVCASSEASSSSLPHHVTPAEVDTPELNWGHSVAGPSNRDDVDSTVGREHITPVVSALEGGGATSGCNFNKLGEPIDDAGALTDQMSVDRVPHSPLDSLDLAVGEKVAEVNAEVHIAVDLKGSAVEQGVVAMGDSDTGIASSPTNVSIGVLDEIIESGKDNKRTLFSAVESVMNKMRQVESKEKEAEQAEVEAATAGVNINVQVEELKDMLGHAREANDMHAGEVYGEKAILSTEEKELQARVANLSEERDSALAVLDEMHRVLEERLNAAEELLRAAEKEKSDKEESARRALVEQQCTMEKVVHESKILQDAAKENSKLREFLMDRCHVVETLQGEISVICQDVRLLKEKIDNRVPLSQSISSSQTSCILASSGLPARTAPAVDDVPAFGDASIVSKHTTPASSSVHAQSPRSKVAEGTLSSTENDACKGSSIAKEPVLDDGWDIVNVNGDV